MKFKCPVCGSNRIEVLKMEYKRNIDLVRCLVCGELLEYVKGEVLLPSDKTTEGIEESFQKIVNAQDADELAAALQENVILRIVQENPGLTEEEFWAKWEEESKKVVAFLKSGKKKSEWLKQ